jgi:hypothetical protein
MHRYYLYTERAAEISEAPPHISSREDYFLIVITSKEDRPVSFECECFLRGDEWKVHGRIKNEGSSCDVGLAHFLAWRKLITGKFLLCYPFPILTYPEDEIMTREYMDLQYILVANPYLWIAPIHRLAERVKRFLLESRLCYPSRKMSQEQLLVYQRQVVDVLAGVDQHLNFRSQEHEASIVKHEEHLASFQARMLHQLTSVLDEVKREMYEEMLLLREDFFRERS